MIRGRGLHSRGTAPLPSRKSRCLTSWWCACDAVRVLMEASVRLNQLQQLADGADLVVCGRSFQGVRDRRRGEEGGECALIPRSGAARGDEPASRPEHCTRNPPLAVRNLHPPVLKIRNSCACHLPCLPRPAAHPPRCVITSRPERQRRATPLASLAVRDARRCLLPRSSVPMNLLTHVSGAPK